MQNEIFYHTLSNGLRIVFRPSDSPVAYVGLMIGVGTRDELPGENGIAHFIEHCAFKGTTKRTSKQIINRVEGIGGEINAFTTKEETTFYAAVPVQYFARTLQLLSEMVFQSTFPAEELEKEKQVILDEIESYNDSPSELIFDDFENMIFSGHPLEKPILGTRRSVRLLNQNKCIKFMQREYATERMILFVVGNLPFKRIVQLAEQYLNTTLNPIHSESIRQKADKYVPSEAGYHKHTHQTHIMLGAKAYPIGHPNQAALYLINQMLGGGSLNSRLNLSLREDKGLVYTVESIYNPMSDTGYWAVYLACEPEHAAQCTDIVNQELNRLREKPLSANALSKYLKQAQGQMAIAAENQENNALSMAKNMLYLNYAPTWQEQYSQLEVLTPKCLQGTAIEIFDKQQISILQYC